MVNFTKNWERTIRDHCDSQYKLITVLPGDLNQEAKCHITAAHYAKQAKHKVLALTTYRYKENLLPCVHFLNFDGKNFIDNTLGHWAQNYEYRFIRWVTPKEFFHTQQILTDTKLYFYNKASFLQKLFGSLSN